MQSVERCHLGWGIVIAVLVSQPVWAEERLKAEVMPISSESREIVTSVPRVRDVKHPATNIKEWLSQTPLPNPQTPVQVTAVKLNRTAAGIEVILETPTGEVLQPVITQQDNTLIADIPNAVLVLPAREFRADNPVVGITLITVTNQDTSTIRVTVTGESDVPVVELFDSDTGLIFGVTLAESKKPDQTATDDEQIEIVVTGEQDAYRVPNATAGTRTDTPTRDVPFSIQVVPEQVLRDRGVQRVTDALRTVSGVTTSDSPVSVFENFNFRGFSTQDFLRNGLRDATSGTAGSGIGNIERIEILKGPTGALFGQGSPGGTINIVTKQPLSSPFYEIEGSIGSFDTYEGVLDFTGPVNMNNETLLYRLTASASKLGSFIDFVDNERYFFSPVLTWLINENTNLSIEAEYLSTKNPNFGGLPAIGTVLSNPNGEVPRSRNLSEPSFDQNNRQVFRIGYNFEHRFSENWQFRNSFRSGLQEAQQRRVDSLELLPDNRTTERRALSLEFTRNIYVLDTNFIGSFETGSIAHNLLFGFDLLRDETRERDFQFFNAEPIDLFDPVYGSQRIGSPTSDSFNFNSRTDGLGIYLQDQITLAENLKILLGGRFDVVAQNEKDDDGETTFFQQDEAFSPRVGLVYQPIPNISLYGSYSRSFTPVAGSTFNNQQFEPERGTQYELGIKGDWLDGRLSTTLALYQITRSNVQTDDPSNPGFSIQTGEQRSRGIELDIAGEILPGWQIIGGYAYTDAQVTEDAVFQGNQINGIPKHAFSLWTTYEIQYGNLQGLGFGLGLYYVGERQGDLDNSFELPDYFRTDAALFYRRDNFQAALNINNLFDVKYFENSFGSLNVVPASPLTVKLTLGWQF